MIEMGRQRHQDIYAVALDLFPPGLSLVRELGKAGVPLCGVYKKGVGEFGRFSRYLSTHIEYSDFSDLLIKLIEFGSKMKQKPVLLPSSDRYIFFIADHYDQLSELYTFQSSYKPETVASTVDKKYLYRSLEKSGVPYPKTWFFDDKPDLIMERFRNFFPIIAKPRLIHNKKAILRSKKVFIIKSSYDLEKFCNRFHDELSDWMLQEIIPGPPSNLYAFFAYLNRESRVISQFTCRKIRQFPRNFGMGSMLVSEGNRTVAQISARYLKDIKFHGICEAEYKFDERDKKFKMMEINTRTPLFSSLASSAGIQVNLSAYRDMTGQVNNVKTNQIDGVVWKHLELDLRGQIASALGKDNEEIPSVQDGSLFPKKSAVKRTGPIWDVADIRPSLFLPRFYLKRAIRRLGAVGSRIRKSANHRRLGHLRGRI